MPHKPTRSFFERLNQSFTDSRWQSYKRFALWGYGVVVTLVLASMLYVLSLDLPQTEGHGTVVHQAAENQAVLRGREAENIYNKPADSMSAGLAKETVSLLDGGAKPNGDANLDRDESADKRAKPDSETLATLASKDGSITIPVKDIEAILPIPQASEPAWRTYAANWAQKGRKHIAIVIDDLGLDQDMSKQLALLEGPLTLSFLPYADDIRRQTKLLRQRGHELMVHLPMQPKAVTADPGPNALLEDIPPAEFERRLQWNLERFTGFVGVNNHMGSALTEDAGLMVRVMVQLRKRGYLFLDSLTSPNSVGSSAARATGVPYIERDVFLDNERSLSAILAQLKKTEDIAAMRGYAVAIGHPYPETLKALQFWSAKLNRHTFSLVPVSQLVAQRSAAEKLAEMKKATGP